MQSDLCSIEGPQAVSSTCSVFTQAEKPGSGISAVAKTVLEEIRQLRRPPASVRRVLEAVYLILDGQDILQNKVPWWKVVRTLSRTDFVERTQKYDAARLKSSPRLLRQLSDEYFGGRDALTPARARRASHAIEALYEWCADCVFKASLRSPSPDVTQIEAIIERVLSPAQLKADTPPPAIVADPTDGPPIWESLHQACAEGDATDVAKWLKLGADPNEHDSGDLTPLMWGCWRADCPEVVHLLIEAGSRIDEWSTNGWRAIHLAARSGKAASLEALIHAGADVNILSSVDQTPLDYAVQMKRVDCEQILRSVGAVMTRSVESLTRSSRKRESGLSARGLESSTEVAEWPQLKKEQLENQAKEEQLKRHREANMETAKPVPQLQQLRKASRPPVSNEVSGHLAMLTADASMHERNPQTSFVEGQPRQIENVSGILSDTQHTCVTHSYHEAQAAMKLAVGTIKADSVIKDLGVPTNNPVLPVVPHGEVAKEARAITNVAGDTGKVDNSSKSSSVPSNNPLSPVVPSGEVIGALNDETGMQVLKLRNKWPADVRVIASTKQTKPREDLDPPRRNLQKLSARPPLPVGFSSHKRGGLNLQTSRPAYKQMKLATDGSNAGGADDCEAGGQPVSSSKPAKPTMTNQRLIVSSEDWGVLPGGTTYRAASIVHDDSPTPWHQTAVGMAAGSAAVKNTGSSDKLAGSSASARSKPALVSRGCRQPDAPGKLVSKLLRNGGVAGISNAALGFSPTKDQANLKTVGSVGLHPAAQAL